MKRGNTALKRVVSVASVAAMAIAGAVLAAPAASAWPATAPEDLVRATPLVDAPWVADASSPDYTADYSSGSTAAPNVVIGQTYQTASGLQIALPATAGAPDWDAGDKVVVTLANATFSQVPGGISLAASPIDKADLAARAGFTGTNATAAPKASTGVLASTAVTAGLSLGNSTLTISLPGITTTATAGDTYLLSINNIKVSVPSTASGATVLPVVAQVGGDALAGNNPFAAGATNQTTIAYVDTLKLALNGTPTITGSTVKLPPIVVTEAAKDAFTSGAAGSFDIKVSGTDLDSSHALTLTAPTGAKAVASSSVDTPALGTLTASTQTVDYTDSVDTSIETVVVSGLTVTNVKPGTAVTVSISDPTGSAANDTTGAAQFSWVPDQDAGASVTLTPGAVLPRIAGSNRYATAADVAEAGSWSGNAVVLANGEDAKSGVDALSANFLAGAVNAPILLTSANTLAPETKSELAKLFDGSTASITLYVMGKTDSVSQAVRDAAVAAIKGAAVDSIATVTVKEVAGSDRYATSAATVATAGAGNIAAYDLGKGNLRTAFLASGTTNADALAAGAVSAGSHIPVLLTSDGDALSADVQSAITSDGIGQVVILGSTDRVSQKVEDALKAAGANVVRLAGADRYATAVLIAQLDRKAPTDGTGQATGAGVYLASGGAGWPDALAAGPLAGQQHASLLTVSDAATLPANTATFLTDNKSALSDVHALGGTDRVQDAVITQAQALLK